MKLLSIIIPSYNSAAFMDENMKTFIDERLFEDAEILLVNDGSKDETANKAAKYEKSYPGFVRLIDKENGGHGSVINQGVREAVGTYFKVIDADDWVDTSNLVRLVKQLKNCAVDLVVNPYIKIDQKTRNTLECGELSSIPANTVVKFADYIKTNPSIALHGVTFKRSVFLDNDIKVTEKCFYEDFQYTLYPVPYIKTMIVLDFPVYYYLVGQKNQSVNAKSGLKNIRMYMQVYSDAIDFYEQIKGSVSNETREYLEENLSLFLRSMYNIFLKNSTEPGILKMMIATDKEAQAKSSAIYNLTGEKNRYIRMIRTGNPIIFKIASLALKRYKKNEML